MLTIDSHRPAASSAPPTFALWNLGFRPFYLLASLFAAVSVLLWVCQYEGYLPAAYLASATWHGHEMLFGYTMAVVAGFLFTAVRNWTGQPTPTGVALAALAALWLLGRILVLTPFAGSAAAANAVFPLAVAVGIGIPIVRSRNRRNYFFIALCVLLGAAVLAFHLAQLGVVDWPARASLQAGLDIVLFVIAVMGGRVIPMFTNNGIPGTTATRDPRVEKAALGVIVLLFAADVVGAPATFIAVVALAAAAIHAVRLALWQPWRTLRTPLVWVLHAAYAWVVVYFALRALAEWQLVAVSLATHALTIGVIGGMTIGMMTRTARGHTGRPLVADRFEVACYVLVQIAALIRVLGGLAVPSLYLYTVVASGLCWSSAFALYAVRYWPILTKSRIDGKPG